MNYVIFFVVGNARISYERQIFEEFQNLSTFSSESQEATVLDCLVSAYLGSSIVVVLDQVYRINRKDRIARLSPFGVHFFLIFLSDVREYFNHGRSSSCSYNAHILQLTIEFLESTFSLTLLQIFFCKSWKAIIVS